MNKELKNYHPKTIARRNNSIAIINTAAGDDTNDVEENTVNADPRAVNSIRRRIRTI